MNHSKPDISRKAFWDVDFDTIDYQKNPDHVIVKVFEWGTLDDIKSLLRYYGVNKIKNALLKTQFLTSDTLHFASALFKIPKEQFQCFTTRQSMKNSIPL